MKTQIQIPTPCTKLCVKGPDGKCKGCLRTMNDLTYWRRFNDSQKIEVWKRIVGEGYKPSPRIDLSFLDE